MIYNPVLKVSRSQFLALIISLCFWPQSPQAAQAQSHLPSDYLTDCTAAHIDIDWCNLNLKTFADDVAGAWAGEYAHVRNMAFCLENSCDHAVITKPTEACAWRLIAFAIAPSPADRKLEQNEIRISCDGVDQESALELIERIIDMGFPADKVTF